MGWKKLTIRDREYLRFDDGNYYSYCGQGHANQINNLGAVDWDHGVWHCDQCGDSTGYLINPASLSDNYPATLDLVKAIEEAKKRSNVLLNKHNSNDHSACLPSYCEELRLSHLNDYHFWCNPSRCEMANGLKKWLDLARLD